MKLEELLSPELYAQVKARIDEVNANEPDKAKHVRFADLSEGGYVSVDKFNSKIEALTEQATELKAQLTQRDSDMADLNNKLTAAQTDASKLAEAQTALTDLQARYDTEHAEWEAKTAQQAYEFRVRELASDLKFTNPAIKRDFLRQVMEKNLPLEGETITGYDDFVKEYSEANPGALAADAPADPAPSIVLPSGSYTPPGKKSLVDLMIEKNEHPDAIIKYD